MKVGETALEAGVLVGGVLGVGDVVDVVVLAGVILVLLLFVLVAVGVVG